MTNSFVDSDMLGIPIKGVCRVAGNLQVVRHEIPRPDLERPVNEEPHVSDEKVDHLDLAKGFRTWIPALLIERQDFEQEETKITKALLAPFPPVQS